MRKMKKGFFCDLLLEIEQWAVYSEWIRPKVSGAPCIKEYATIREIGGESASNIEKKGPFSPQI